MGRIPRIPAPVVERFQPPTTRFPQPPVTTQLAPPVIAPPSYDPPSYSPPPREASTPMPDPEEALELAPEPAAPPIPSIPPQMVDQGPKEETRELEENEEYEGDTSDLEAAAEGYNQPLPTVPTIPVERPEIEVPFVGTVPLPQQREVMLAGTTAVGATAAALIGKSLVEQLLKIMKPLVKKIMLKIKEKSGKQFNDYELQQFFEFEKRVPEQKVVTKKLAKEQKAEKAAQLEAELQRRQNRRKRKGS